MRLIVSILFVMAGFLSFKAHALQRPVYRLTLNECVQLALKNNEDIKATHHDLSASFAKKIEATKRYVPVVKYQYRFAPVPRDLDNAVESFFSGDISVFNSIKIEAGVPVSTFGRLAVAKELADIGIDASRLGKRRKADEIILDVYKLYNGILLAREMKVLAEKGLNAVEEKVEELETEETTDQLQILKLKAILYQVQKKLDEAHTKETIALAMLKVRLGLEDDVGLVLKDSYLKREYFPLQSFDELVRQSRENRPEFKLIRHQVSAKQREIILKKKEYYPKLIFGGFFDYGVAPGIRGDENENTFTNPFNFTKAGIGLELSGELDFRKIKSQVEVARAQHLKAIAEKRSNDRLLKIDLKKTYLELKQKQDLLYRAEKEQRSARQIVFLTKSNLDIGLGDKKEYLEALQSYLLIQAAVYENIFNYNVAVAELKQRIGRLYDGSALNTGF